MFSHDWVPGTILRFKGADGRNVHMGFVATPIRVMELIGTREVGRNTCRIYLTNVNEPHPLTGYLPKWKFWELPPYDWSLEGYINRIENAYKMFDGTGYSQIYNNCQHFVYMAVTGKKKSPDADKWRSVGWFADKLGLQNSIANSSAVPSNAEYRKNAKLLIQLIKSKVSGQKVKRMY
ncbi:MAG: hypothetical protein AB4426_21990 [Xenococcaceae cyanobacterium]